MVYAGEMASCNKKGPHDPRGPPNLNEAIVSHDSHIGDYDIRATLFTTFGTSGLIGIDHLLLDIGRRLLITVKLKLIRSATARH